MIYHFKVIFEDYEDVQRVIEIKSVQTFHDLHLAIQKAIGFDNSKNASFYMSDDYWRKGTEITLKDETDYDDDPRKKPKKLMSKSKLADFIEDPHQKILYIFDFSAHWNFMIELIKITKDDPKTEYPKCSRSIGIAPKQYKVIKPPTDEDDEEEDDHEHAAKKIFDHEEGLDYDDDESLEGEEGEDDIPSEEEHEEEQESEEHD